MRKLRVTGIASVEDYIYLAQSRQGAKKLLVFYEFNLGNL